MSENKFELAPGIKGEPLFTPEEYDKFRKWWREEMVPEIRKLEELHIGPRRMAGLF